MKSEIAGLRGRTTWFTSDTHLGHLNIIKYSNRPYADVLEMDSAFIASWNARVGYDDDIFHVGDFCYRSAKAASSYLERLNGRKHLIWGNHDPQEVRDCPGWASSAPMREISVDGQGIVLCHYGMRVWNGSHHSGDRATLHFYGHSHGRLPGNDHSVDVGVDYPAWNYAPVRLDEIRRHLRTLPPYQSPEVAERGSTT